MTDWKDRNPVVTPCGNYVYEFEWEFSKEGKPCVFIMLNPSTTLKFKGNRTIKNCKTIADSEEICGRKNNKIITVDLFPYVAKDAEALKDASLQGKKILGPSDEHEKHLRNALKIKDALIILAWGDVNGSRRSIGFRNAVNFSKRADDVKRMIKADAGNNKIKILKDKTRINDRISHPLWVANANRLFKQENGKGVKETWQEHEKRVEEEVLRNAELDDCLL